jgi:hypothetical protein
LGGSGQRLPGLRVSQREVEKQREQQARLVVLAVAPELGSRSLDHEGRARRHRAPPDPDVIPRAAALTGDGAPVDWVT